MCPAVGDAERVGRRHTWVPPYRGISKGAVKRVVGDADPYAHLVGGRCGRDDGGIVPYKKLVGRGSVPRRWGCSTCRRRHTWVPPYGSISRGTAERGVEDAAPYREICKTCVGAGDSARPFPHSAAHGRAG